MAHMSTTAPWATEHLRFLAGIRELEIAVPHADGRPGAWTPIWVVVVALGLLAAFAFRREDEQASYSAP